MQSKQQLYHTVEREDDLYADVPAYTTEAMQFSKALRCGESL